MAAAWREGLLAAALVTGLPAMADDAPDPAAAERQYKLAQRLSADGSPDAAAAYGKVVALAPRGPFADDALVDLARLRGAPDWPEDLGGVDAARVSLAKGPLEKVVEAYPEGDRVLEARYRLALIRLAPCPGRDAARARRELIALASMASRDRWVVAGRYALGFLDELSGAPERAAGAFGRVLLEHPDSDVAPRASAGFARTLLAEGRFGEAATWLQQAIEGGASPTLHAEHLRELALRELLRDRTPSRPGPSVNAKLPVVPTTRGAVLLATAADGRMAVYDRKNDALQMFDANGLAGAPVPLAEVTALASDPYGRIFVATKDNILRWDAAGVTVLSSLGGLGTASAIAVDAAGSIWIADRKGDRIARWVPGKTEPELVRESKGAGVTALAVAGSRVIVAEEKTGKLIAIAESGVETPFGGETFKRPVALYVDAAGRIGVLDAKTETLTRLDPNGRVRDTLPLGAAGVSRPIAIAAALDGSARILDGGTGSVTVAP